MKKIMILTALFFLSTLTANAQTTAPIPSCACNNIASQLGLDKNAEAQTQKEIEQMDKEANSLENGKTKTTQQQNISKQHRWFWQR